MKEVFENLAEQAMVHVPGQTGLHTRAFSLEKFAELIVKECLKIAKNREDELESAGLLEESNAVGNVAYRISRQFGVKR
jgi:hypothetical protein